MISEKTINALGFEGVGEQAEWLGKEAGEDVSTLATPLPRVRGPPRPGRTEASGSVWLDCGSRVLALGPLPMWSPQTGAATGLHTKGLGNLFRTPLHS